MPSAHHGDVEIHWFRAGDEAGEPIVLIAGLSGTHRDWHRLVPVPRGVRRRAVRQPRHRAVIAGERAAVDGRHGRRRRRGDGRRGRGVGARPRHLDGRHDRPAPRARSPRARPLARAERHHAGRDAGQAAVADARRHRAASRCWRSPHVALGRADDLRRAHAARHAGAGEGRPADAQRAGDRAPDDRRPDRRHRAARSRGRLHELRGGPGHRRPRRPRPPGPPVPRPGPRRGHPRRAGSSCWRAAPTCSPPTTSTGSRPPCASISVTQIAQRSAA